MSADEEPRGEIGNVVVIVIIQGCSDYRHNNDIHDGKNRADDEADNGELQQGFGGERFLRLPDEIEDEADDGDAEAEELVADAGVVDRGGRRLVRLLVGLLIRLLDRRLLVGRLLIGLLIGLLVGWLFGCGGRRGRRNGGLRGGERCRCSALRACDGVVIDLGSAAFAEHKNNSILLNYRFLCC